MGRLPKKIPTSRLNLEMSQPVRTRLEKLRDQTCSDSLTEVIRNALAVYEYLFQNTRSGGKVVIHSPDGSEREVVLLK